MAERVFKDFDLPKEHLTGIKHYIPPRARKAEEVERRRGRAPGVLLAEQQHRGLRMSAVMLRNIHEPEDIYFTRRLLEASLFNSGWYSAACGSLDVQRRRLKLPLLTEASNHSGVDLWTMLRRSADMVEAVAVSAGKLVTLLEYQAPRVQRTEVQVGRQIGNSSLLLAAANLARIAPAVEDATIQRWVRHQGLAIVQDSRRLVDEVGSYPSVAQLAEPDSDLGVFWRREAPDGALEAYEMAMAA